MAEENTKYYISPNSEIRVLKNIPLDNTYEHTIAWDEQTDARGRQEAYFKSHTKYVFPKQYYTRSSRGWVRVGQPSNVNPGNELEKKKFLCADDFYDCNYMMFQNTSFGNKWFYAFITKVNYINDNTTELEYEIDVMQTWLRGVHYDYDPDPCFIERMHTPSDDMFENVVPESIDLGNEYVNTAINYVPLNRLAIMIVINTASLTDINYSYLGHYIGNDAGGILFNGVYGNVAIVWFYLTNDDIKNCNDFLNLVIRKGEEKSIVNIYMCPAEFLEKDYARLGYQKYVKPVKPPASGDYLGTPTKQYKPVNKKLYNYPFCKLLVSNQCGNTHEYKWELFDNNQNRGMFKLAGKIAWRPSAAVIPVDYKGFGDVSAPNYTVENLEESVKFENFPICAWSGDAFKAWWAQNANSTGASLLTNIGILAAGLGTGIATGGLGLISTMAMVGSASSLVKTFAHLSDAKHMPDQVYGDVANSDIGASLNNIGFTFYKQSLRPEILKIIDDYFSKFGYAVKDIRKPPYLNRERWTYVKTSGFNMTGRMNNDDSSKIAEIYDNGITFWRNPSDVGNYGLSNKPII